MNASVISDYVIDEKHQNAVSLSDWCGCLGVAEEKASVTGRRLQGMQVGVPAAAFELMRDEGDERQRWRREDDLQLFCPKWQVISHGDGGIKEKISKFAGTFHSSGVAASTWKKEKGVWLAAGAFYQHLFAKDKKLATKKSMATEEIRRYFKKDKVFKHQRIFRGLDMDDNGSLDFEEAKVLFYIMESGKAITCMSCKTFMAGAYFSCSQCFFDGAKSKFDICCDCYGGNKFKHHRGATFCDNYTLLSQSRSSAIAAPAEKRRDVLGTIDKIVGVASIAVAAGWTAIIIIIIIIVIVIIIDGVMKANKKRKITLIGDSWKIREAERQRGRREAEREKDDLQFLYVCGRRGSCGRRGGCGRRGAFAEMRDER
uniref:EF-hand domain-containing protein n=1 Tax=Salix viminalis TaxID=40686 RepID=A0A6N2MIG7_SALVM